VTSTLVDSTGLTLYFHELLMVLTARLRLPEYRVQPSGLIAGLQVYGGNALNHPKGSDIEATDLIKDRALGQSIWWCGM
jgi:hypothetical protein